MKKGSMILIFQAGSTGNGPLPSRQTLLIPPPIINGRWRLVAVFAVVAIVVSVIVGVVVVVVVLLTSQW